MKKKYSLIALLVIIIILLSVIIGLITSLIGLFERQRTIPFYTYPSSSQYCPNQPVIYNSSNVLGYWKLNENSGVNATDSSGNENHGIVAYDNWTAGKLNNSLSYNGINQSVNCGNIDYSGDFTIEFWTYIRDNVSRLCFIDDYSTSPSTQGILILRLFSVVAFYVFDYSSGYNLVYHTALGINTYQWYHIVYAFDIDDYYASTPYINGNPSKYGEYVVGNVANYSNTVNFTIGYSPILSFYIPPDGYMDNVILYNRTLTHKEVLSQYNKGAGYEGYPDGYDPIMENITEYSDPSEYGYNINITVDVCDYSGIDFVYLDDGNVNYTMTNIYGNTYSYATWIPNYSGYRDYKIWCKDMRTNTIYQQGSVFVIDSTETVLTLITVFLFLIMELIIYFKLKPHKVIKFPLIAVVFLFALVINVASIGSQIPFTPYIQFFLLIFEGVIFVMTSLEYYKNKKVDKY